MNPKEEALLHRLQTSVRQLLTQDRRLQQRCETLSREVERQQARIGELEEQHRVVSERYANLKIAKSMELSEEDTRAAHRRLSSLVRQVDECLALLKQ